MTADNNIINTNGGAGKAQKVRKQLSIKLQFVGWFVRNGIPIVRCSGFTG